MASACQNGVSFKDADNSIRGHGQTTMPVAGAPGGHSQSFSRYARNSAADAASMPSFAAGLQNSKLERLKSKAKLAGDVAVVAKHSRLTRMAGGPPGWKKKRPEWVPFLDNGDFEQSKRIENIDAVRDLDLRRKNLLRLSRNLSPVQTVATLSLLPRTVLPRIIMYPFTWAIFACFIVSSAMSRAGFDFGEVDPAAFEGGTAVITFMIVFYVGYCYTRYNQQFDDVERIMHSITNACMMARVNFKDLNEVHRFWRYLNMLHAAAYTSLTTFYSEENFFRPVCEKWELHAHDEEDRAAEASIFADMKLDGQDMRVCSMLEVWLFEIVRDEMFVKVAKHSPAMTKVMLDEVMKVGDSVKRLFTYQYQVLPFIYTHLVSLCCTAYLFFFAFLKGLHFHPDAGFCFGFLLPLCSVLLSTLAIFGLLEVGDTIGDPFGSDPEDFAVLHFVECTAVASLEAIQADNVVPRHKTNFYSNTELRAAIAVATRMVYRFRARKKLRMERELAERQASNSGGHDATPSTQGGVQATHSAPEAWGSMDGISPDGARSDRAELRQEAQLSAKPLKTRPPAELQQKKRKPRSRQISADGVPAASAAPTVADRRGPLLASESTPSAGEASGTGSSSCEPHPQAGTEQVRQATKCDESQMSC